MGHNGCKRGGDRDKGLPLEILLFHGSSTNQLSDALSNYWGEAGSNGNESLPLEIRVHSLKILKLSSVDQSTDALADGGSKSAGDGQKSLPLKILVLIRAHVANNIADPSKVGVHKAVGLVGGE